MKTSLAVGLSDLSQTEWWRTGVVYQVYPRSFADVSGDGLGDLPGIEHHLDHLNDGTPSSLGIDAIWLSPIFPSPDFDFGYDVADYVGIDSRFGTLEDFQRLVDACHARGIRVILDLVLNHTSHLHPWFVESRKSRTGPFADWYIWRDPPGRSQLGGRRLPNNWRSFFGGPAWAWDEERGQFYLHTFLPEQPDLNWRNPETRAALLEVVRTWLDRGVDGFRLDVFNVFFKDAELRSNPRRLGRRGGWSWQRHIHDRDQPELADALHDLRALVESRQGTMTVGELFDGSPSKAAALTAPRHLAFDFSLISQPWTAAAFRKAIAEREEAYGPLRWPTVVLSNHDQPRHASRFDDPRHGDARVKVAATLGLTLRGTPFMYYGEEIGLRNIKVPKVIAADPPARRASLLFPWWNRDQARGPMPWSPGPGGGFTTGQPWLPLAPDWDSRNVAAQDADPDSLLSYYRRLLWLRKATPALNAGTFHLADAGHRDVLAYWRRSPDGTAFVALNFAATPVRIRIPAIPGARPLQVALSTHPRAAGAPFGDSQVLAGNEAIIAVDR